ncbi:hypothetical protein [Paraurantiacibacter namhicola]|uniref:Uncharacterized protein n=1 Tax=Paraurantiacibacter namhicola TaxID=645517 RepID=A0A1C7D9T7_9SPHN|nr:hypothetical protein [Paraurantiacibacter namhicola]ANU08081.1 hypothetical protein A6F65_01786 [Paraurantiacibacter namhicola]
MRIAIIGINGGAGAELAGATLAERQLDLAMDLGAERVIALGHGADPAAIALRTQAEGAGLSFQCVPAIARRLLGLVGAADDIIVLAPGLLINDRRDPALQSLAKERGVLAFPADAGMSAGFERIDADTAWAGVLVAPGQVVERLSVLPDDADPVSGLLRGARQSNVRLVPVSKEHLDRGDWRLFVARSQVEDYAPKFLISAGGVLPAAPSRWLGGLLARLAAARLPGLPGYAWPLLSALLVGGALASGAYRETAWGLALLALAALVHHLGAARHRIARKGLKNIVKQARMPMAGLLVIDAAFVVVVVLSSLGPLGPRIFVPLVLVLSIRSLARLRLTLSDILRDRGLLCAGASIAAAAGQFAPAAMLWTILALALLALWPERARG